MTLKMVVQDTHIQTHLIILKMCLYCREEFRNTLENSSQVQQTITDSF